MSSMFVVPTSMSNRIQEGERARAGLEGDVGTVQGGGDMRGVSVSLETAIIFIDYIPMQLQSQSAEGGWGGKQEANKHGERMSIADSQSV